MPSFLSKVFGRVKEDAVDVPKSPKGPKGHKSHPSLLEGKFEAVVTPASPTAANFAEAYAPLKEKEGVFTLFKSKSRPSASLITSSTGTKELPTLSLNFPGQKEENGSRALGVVFEGGRLVLLDDSVIGAKRLDPTETLALVRACSQAITERGLETLGIMHPHWHSASPEIQRRLISLFIQSLAKKNTIGPTPFETELKFTRSPHDVAAVLRWGLRHLKLDGGSFGKDSSEWSWYQNFSASERAADYPPKAFSEKLVSLLPTSHLDLLLATLEIESSLAAHAEHNSISGSKLSKFLGLWLLTSSRSGVSDDWDAFYARWERAGRILEHLFLCRIRDESVNHRMPTRLMELVNQYPYKRSLSSTDEELLPRPRFSTRSYDALFVRIDTELSTSTGEKPKRDRLRLLAEAFRLDLPSEGGEYAAVWDKVKRAAVETSNAENGFVKESPVLNRVFADETIRLLSLIPADGTGVPINLISPSIALPAASRRRSFSLGRIPGHKGTNTLAPSNNNVTTAQAKATAIPLSPSPAIDWTEFTTAGFGEASTVSQHLSATLFDDEDVEITDPSVVRKLSKGKRTRDTSRRSSVDNSNLPLPNGTSPQQKVATSPPSKATLMTVIQLDEAFIDFWSDAAIDPISASWPTFVICKLNSIPGVQTKEAKPINWLVIEQTYSSPPAPRVTSPTSASKRPSSPKPSVKSDVSRMASSLSATRKRFSFFGGSSTVSSGNVAKTKSKRKISLNTTRTGEFGEILPEVQEKPESKNDTAAAEGADIKESTAVAGSGAAEPQKPNDNVDGINSKESATVADPVVEPTKPKDNVDTVHANEFAAFAGIVALVDAAVEKATSPTAPQTLEHTKTPTKSLSPALRGVVLSGSISGPQVALDAKEAEPTAVASPGLVEDVPGPQLMSDKQPATIEPLKNQEHTSVLPKVEETPVIPALTEQSPAPESITAAEPVMPTLPQPEAPAVELEVAPERVKELEVDGLELATEASPIPLESLKDKEKIYVPPEVEEVVATSSEQPSVPEVIVETPPTVPTLPALGAPAPVELAPAVAPEQTIGSAVLELVSDKVPATADPLADREELATEEVPLTPISTEEAHALEPAVESESVEPVLPTQIADTLASVELAPSIASDPVKEPEMVAEEPVGLMNEMALEPTQHVTPEPVVQATSTETNAELVEEPHSESALADELAEHEKIPAEASEPAVDAMPAESIQDQPETSTEPAAPPVAIKSEETRNDEADEVNLPEETS